MKKRALSWLLALCMLVSLAPQALPTWASAAGESDTSESKTETKLSSNTYSALGLSRDVDTSGLDDGKQPYGKADVGNTIATNVINELYVNFNGSIHYGWSILDNIPMQYRDGADIGNNWTSSDNFYGAMGYWRPNQQTVNYKSGKESNGALFAKQGSNPQNGGVHDDHLGKSINSANKHLTYQYSKSEAFSPNTGKDNYVAELMLDSKNDVYLYLYQVENGKKRYVQGQKVTRDDYAGNTDTIIYNWEYDAMYDIAAGDMDGDGYDEIAVYAENHVYLYSFREGELNQLVDTYDVINPSTTSDEIKYKKLKTAVVTLAFGDLNADDKDELVIAENIGYGANNIKEGTVGIYTLGNDNTKDLTKVMNTDISLLIPNSNKIFSNNDIVVRYANVATGDIDGDYQDELIIAGYVSAKNDSAKCNRGDIAYMIVKGDSDNQFQHSEWKAVDKNNNRIDLLDRVVDNEKQLIPPVSLTCAATQGVGHAEQLFLGGWLYSVSLSADMSVTLSPLTRISTNREYKKDNGNKANKEEIFVVNVVAGNFNGNRNGQEQIVYAFGMKHDDSDRYWYDIGYINKKAPGDTDAKDSKGYWYGQEQVMNYESSYNRDSSKARASLYLSLAAVDCDDDSTLMRYKGKTVTWTKPEVLTVLQSAPYFQDLEDTRGYLNQGQTGLGKSTATGDKVTAGGSLSLGTYVSFEQDFSVFGVKVASIEAEAQSKNSFTYAYEQTKTKETEINYSGSAGDDYAVVYAVPYMEYQYETWVPGYTLPNDDTKYNEYIDNYLSGKLENWSTIQSDDAKLRAERQKAEKELGIHKGMPVQGSWQPSSVMVPMEPAKVLITVDDYDEIAEQTEGLEPIRGNILNSTPGDPSTYDNGETPRSGFTPIGDWQTVTKGEGGNISVTETSTSEENHTFEYSYEFEAKVGAGAGGLTVGVLAGFGANAGGGISSSKSKSYSATVDNLPKDADGYGFSWQFGWREAKLNNNDVLVLEYEQKGTYAKPSPPKNLRVESVTSDSVTLSWEPVTGAGAYNIYQLDSTGKAYIMKTLAGTATTWTNEELDSNSSYTYVAETITQDGNTSLTSKEVEARTLESKGSFQITHQPDDPDPIITGYAGSNVTLTLEAQYLGTDNKPKTLRYQWEVYNKETKTWESASGASNAASYTATVTDANDGERYRCLVYSTANLRLYSREVTLQVGLADSKTVLTDPGSIAKSTYFITKEVEATDSTGNFIYEQVPVVDNGRTKYSYKDGYVYVEETTNATTGEKSYSYYAGAEDTTAFTQVPQQVLTFGDKSYDVKLENASTEVNGKTYIVEAGTGDATQHTYTPQKVYSLTLDGKNIKLYNCIEENTLTDGSKETVEFWFMEDDQFKQYVAEVETVQKLQIGTALIDISSLEVVTKQSTTPAKTTVQEKQDGDTVNLSVTVSDNTTSGDGKTPTGKVTFKIVNTTGDGGVTETVDVDENTGTASTTWKPTTAGVYVVTAIYSGSETFKESQSKSYTINVVTPGEQKLVLSGENMTYGDTQELKATLFDGKNGTDSSSTSAPTVSATDVSSNATYTVTRDGEDVSSDLSGTTFTPSQAGTYTITATYAYETTTTDASGNTTKTQNSITTTKVIVVGRKTVKIVPKVVDNSGTLSTGYDITPALLNGDTIDPSKITVTCDAVKQQTSSGGTSAGDTTTKKPAAGVYPITVTYAGDTNIDKKYLVVCDNDQKYTIEDNVIQVTNATTDSNGKVILRYTYKDSTYEVGGDGGSGKIPVGATLTAEAVPNVGYRVAQWKINDKPHYTGDGHTLVTDSSISVPISDNADHVTVAADFTQIFYQVTYQGTGATVTANYLNQNGGTGSAFNSGSQLSPLQEIQLTATPDSGKVISGWQIKTGDKTEIVKNNDDTNYTGNTYKLSKISGDTEVTVLTEDAAGGYPVTVKLVDNEGQSLGMTNATVSFNPAEQGTTNENGIYTYHGQKYQNLVISLNISDTLIVDSWTSAAEQNVKYSLSSDKKTLTISNLTGPLDLTVKCVTPNSYPVTVTKKGEGDIKIYKNLESTALTLDNNSSVQVRQASSLRVVLKPTSGWQVLNVLVNNEPVTLENVTDNLENKAFTIRSVAGDTNINVTFVKKPVIKFSETPEGETAHGTVTANGMEVSGGTVPYGYKNAIAFTATPGTGYEVDKWTVNGEVKTAQEVENSDNQTYTYKPGDDGIISDLTVTVSFKELPKATVEFSVVDKNNETDGGFDGTIQATVTRKGQTTTSSEVTSGNFADVYRDSKVTFAAEPAAGYKVTKWLVGDREQSTPPVLDIVEGDNGTTKKVQVQFEKISDKIIYAIDENSDAGHGATLDVKFLSSSSTKPDSVTSGNSVNGPGVLTVTVNGLNDGYEIESWILNGAPYTSDENGKLTCNVSETQGADIKVKIVRKSYQITFSATEGGTITAKVGETALTSPASVKGDTKVAFTASQPQTGYEFVGWNVDGTTVPDNTSLTYTLDVSKNTTVEARYALTTAKYQVTYGIIQTSGQDNGTLAVSGLDSSGKANAGSNITFTATPVAGYQVEQWYNAATSGTAIGAAESTTYEIEKLTANASVYVQFEPIPTYNITVNVSGQGSVTATVNGNPATITNNTLEVKRHDSVVLTAEPEAGHHLKEWTGGTASQANPLILTLSDVTDHHTIAANFEVNQGVPFQTICGAGGSLEAKAGYGNNLQPIKADTGIQVDKGKKIVLKVTHPSDQAVVWTVNNQPTNELSKSYTIDAISEDTTVKATFEELCLYEIPTDMSNDTYSISSVTKYPTDYGEATQIRKGGTVSFKLTPKKPVMGLQGLPENAKVVYNSDGSYTVTVTNVTSNISFQMKEYQAKTGDLQVPSGSSYTESTLKSALRAKISSSVSGSDIAYLDIKLQIKKVNTDGTFDWVDVTSDNFPQGGIDITIPYSALKQSGLDSSYNYSVAHMLANGTVENLSAKGGTSGVTFHVNSLSPFAIGWYKASSPGGGGVGGGGVVSTVTLSFETNGGSSIEKITKESGTTVDLAAYKPTRAGYTFAGWFSDKALTQAVTSVKLTANTTVYAKWTQGGTTQNPFVDVKDDAYYYDAVLWAVEQKITSGTSATTFSPEASCTRAQMVTFLWRAAGSHKVENGKNPFTDVKADAYYYDAVLWAVEQKITSGTSATTFSPDATVTRGQTVTFLYRNAGSPDVTGTMPFADVEADAYYAKAVLWAVEQKITTGTSETTFSPASDCTRGQIVTFLYRAK